MYPPPAWTAVRWVLCKQRGLFNNSHNKNSLWGKPVLGGRGENPRLLEYSQVLGAP